MCDETGLKPGFHLEFTEDLRHMCLDGAFGHAEACGDAAVGMAGAEHQEHLVLARREVDDPGERVGPVGQRVEGVGAATGVRDGSEP
ncbi:hypothetical protein VT52_026565 [Streptomyces malaysiense]|uniref:Uncharacterized protein n=1 Tax=Streptomyces malaysiense TaxID=1428626 RepID=A0A1J4PX38_9ACTN|nr:hypothetical protein VT52_026565 [Streptomyces malaysiense]